MSAALLALLPPNPLEDPCEEGLAWVEALPEGTTPQQAWDMCPNAGYLMWVLAECPQKVELARTMARAMVACARELALAVVGIHDARFPERALRPSINEHPWGIHAAACVVYAAGNECSDAPLAAAAAVAYAAYAIDSIGKGNFESAVECTLKSAGHAATAADDPALQAQLADIVRKHFPTCPLGGST